MSMGASRVRLVIGALSALCVVVLLAGCGGEAAPAPEPSETAVEDSPTPSADPEPNPNADLLFTITANVRAVDGRTVGISMAAHEPIASTDPEAAGLVSELLSVCSAGNGAQPITELYLKDNGSVLMRIQLSTNTPGLQFASPIDLFFGSPYFAQSATGDGLTPEPDGQACFYGYSWTTSGDAQGIADFENPDGVPDVSQWVFGHYGFSVNPSFGATIEACIVTMTDLGMKSGVNEVDGWDVSRAATGISCGIGYSGE